MTQSKAAVLQAIMLRSARPTHAQSRCIIGTNKQSFLRDAPNHDDEDVLVYYFWTVLSLFIRDLLFLVRINMLLHLT